ncbi:hypothetical protein [Bradyrhizobium sp. CCBAU 45384]|uniref:hypothetical protein n=1 Tax=Bradyrhizobium sp. CCBAU 45384 TaxID=858428 RepID=UPI002FE01300
MIMVEIKLKRSQRQRDERAEQQNGRQQAETDTAAQLSNISAVREPSKSAASGDPMACKSAFAATGLMA